jgi:mRNA interferase MazF
MGLAIAGPPVRRGHVYLVRLDPTLVSEIKKTRPCVAVSPDELNEHLRTVIVAPMTTGGRAYPWRPRCRFQGRAGFVALDQLRTVDVERVVKSLGPLEAPVLVAVLERLQDMFAG